ncbi:MAG: NIPSNAP family protein [Gemmataceae bacterium]|nr:NIPSNAP family protein [Gemmataceae bacterium]
MRTSHWLVGAAILVAGVYLARPEAEGGKNVNQRVFEMRTYYAHPGKMKALHARFRDHTCKLFEKHGMTNIGYWMPTDAKLAEEKMVYILAYPSKAAAAKSWKDFANDPAWKKAKAASEVDGPLVAKVESVYLNPTDYSPIK